MNSNIIKDCSESFASHEKSKYWSNTNNVSPRNVHLHTRTKYDFCCNVCNHIFNSSVSNIVNGRWCPYCSHSKLCNDDCNICYNNSFASHEKSKYWSSTNLCKPRDIMKSTKIKYLFDCDTCNHSFEIAPSYIVHQNQWCQYCGNNSLCNNDDCKLCYNKSFASHEKSKYWSNKNNVLPKNIFKNTKKKYYFDCDKCSHIFELSPKVIVMQNQWCQYCNNSKLCDDDECQMCFQNSFASNEKSKYWSINNTIRPRDITRATENIYLFNCTKCKHEFLQSPKRITCQNSWCNYCSHSHLCSNIDCEYCLEHSFASNPRSKYWSKKNNVEPRFVSKSANDKYYFNCEICASEIYMSPNNITHHNQWCSCRLYKTEAKFFELVSKIYPTLQKEFSVDWCKSKSFLPFDFVIQEEKIIIELDGEQHFKQVSNWKSPEETQKIDKYKMKCAAKNGYQVIRLLQKDVWEDKYDWISELCNWIEIAKSEKVHIFLCQNDEYLVYEN